MPTTKDCGIPGEANKKIGGVPTIHYFDYVSRGRGEVLRLFFEEAGIAYKDVRYSFEEHPKWQEAELTKMNPVGSLPIVELNGRVLAQSYAILRSFSRRLQKYDGETEDEKFWADAMCDLALDWRTLFVLAFFTPDKETEYPKHIQSNRPKFLHGLEEQLASSDLSSTGPFVLGNIISYADIVIYQIAHDEDLVQDGRKGLKDYPRLVKLVDGVENRPNVKSYRASNRYLG